MAQKVRKKNVSRKKSGTIAAGSQIHSFLGCSHTAALGAIINYWIDGMKTCIRCAQKFPAEHFYRNGKGKNRTTYCRACSKLRLREYVNENRDSRRAYQRKRYAKTANLVHKQNVHRKYGLTEDQVDYLLNCAQCDICGDFGFGRKLVVDHDHASGRNRGILCNNCNTALGLFKDDITSLRHAIKYLTNGGSGYFDG